MLGRFGRDAGSLIGIEIADGVVRVLQAGPGRQLRWAVEPLEPGAWSDPRAASRERVAHALARALAHAGIKGRRAAVALPAALVVERQLSLPVGLGEAETDRRLREALEPGVPFPIDDAALDYQVLGPCEKGPQAVRMRCVLCQQEDLEPYVEVLETGGLLPCVAEPDSLALARAGLARPLPEGVGPEMAVAYGLALREGR
jgi:type IV pilus assembly protein PilM